jgi:RimJ/RimL family protein N-acetyltransferase
LLGYGPWIVRERATGSFVGEVGIVDLHRDITPLIDAPEAGWVLSPAAHGHGYATEAVNAALAWRDANVAGNRTVCMIDPENVASIRVAAKCGFHEFGRTAYKDAAVILFERLSAVNEMSANT